MFSYLSLLPVQPIYPERHCDPKNNKKQRNIGLSRSSRQFGYCLIDDKGMQRASNSADAIFNRLKLIDVNYYPVIQRIERIGMIFSYKSILPLNRYRYFIAFISKHSFLFNTFFPGAPQCSFPANILSAMTYHSVS